MSTMGTQRSWPLLEWALTGGWWETPCRSLTNKTWQGSQVSRVSPYLGRWRRLTFTNYPFLVIIFVKKNIYIHNMKSQCSTLLYIILMFDFLYLQLMYLSQERLSFGNLPLFSRARRMVFVTNKAKDRDVSFEWHVTSQADAQVSSTSCPWHKPLFPLTWTCTYISLLVVLGIYSTLLPMIFCVMMFKVSVHDHFVFSQLKT